MDDSSFTPSSFGEDGDKDDVTLSKSFGVLSVVLFSFTRTGFRTKLLSILTLLPQLSSTLSHKNVFANVFV